MMLKKYYQGLLWIAALVVVLGTAGCSPKGFDRGKIQARFQDQPREVTEEAIKRAYETQAQISFPFRLAVYFDPMTRSEGYSPYHHKRTDWRWEEKDQEVLKKVQDTLKESGVVSEVIIMSDAVVHRQTLRSIRLAAARYQADAVLVVRAVAEIDRYYNPLAALYATIFGFWVFPGSHYNALFMMEGVLWDVGNEYLYLTASAEGTNKVLRPGGYIETKEVIAPAKQEAISAFTKELVTRLQNLKGKDIK